MAMLAKRAGRRCDQMVVDQVETIARERLGGSVLGAGGGAGVESGVEATGAV